MNPSFTRGEYWLLDAVVEYRLGIDVAAREDVAEALNRQTHGLSRPELADTLMGLLGKCLIQMTRPDDSLVFPEREAVVAAMDQGYKQPGNLTYGLTAEGGRLWEQFTRPEWNRFVARTSSRLEDEEEDVEEHEYVCACKERLEGCLKLNRLALCYMEEGSAKWDMVEPWQATYWKQLPRGHRLRFRGSVECKHFPPNPLRMLQDKYRWYGFR
jgi:hypothetical protein